MEKTSSKFIKETMQKNENANCLLYMNNNLRTANIWLFTEQLLTQLEEQKAKIQDLP